MKTQPHEPVLSVRLGVLLALQMVLPVALPAKLNTLLLL